MDSSKSVFIQAPCQYWFRLLALCSMYELSLGELLKNHLSIFLRLIVFIPFISRFNNSDTRIIRSSSWLVFHLPDKALIVEHSPKKTLFMHLSFTLFLITHYLLMFIHDFKHDFTFIHMLIRALRHITYHWGIIWFIMSKIFRFKGMMRDRLIWKFRQ